MRSTSLKAEIPGDFDDVIAHLTDALKAEGFGVLTRIDLHEKFREKLGKEILPATILGACNPQLAYDAYQYNTDVATLLPCNAVVRELRPGRCSVELVRPTGLLEPLGDERLIGLAESADQSLERCLDRLVSAVAA